jgi:hypothetical protein
VAYGRGAMQQPAIQAALNNLVEAIRTALMAEFVEYSRGGDKEPVSGKRAPKGRKSAKKAAKKAPLRKSAKKAAKKAR